jgi:uncharacterized damage-inducible protein DinB
MRRRTTCQRYLLAFVLSGLFSVATLPQAASQKAAQPALTSSQMLLQSWNDIGRKLIAMAEDFPEDKYDFKPTPAQRTFAEQLLHVAGSNDLFSDVAVGQKAVDDEDRSHYPGKAAVVDYLKRSFEKGSAAIRAKSDADLAAIVLDPDSGRRMPLLSLGWELVEHSGEHYGQLVVYYRVAGLVPPESRPKK